MCLLYNKIFSVRVLKCAFFIGFFFFYVFFFFSFIYYYSRNKTKKNKESEQRISELNRRKRWTKKGRN